MKPAANGSTDRKTKAQLQQELDEAYKTIKKQESQLNATKKELQKSQAKTKELQARLDETRSQLDETQSELQNMMQRSNELQREFDEYKEKSRENENDFESLKNQLQIAEEGAAKQIEEAKREQREAERQRQNLEGEVRELNQKLAELEIKLTHEQSEEPVESDLSVSKSTFRIDIYPRQGHFQGKIEHPLTKDKKAFRGIDHTAIVDFISSHLPQLEEEVENGQPLGIPFTSAVPKLEEPMVEEGVRATKKFDQVPRVQTIQIIPSYSQSPSNMLQHDQPFEVLLNLDISDMDLPSDAPVHHIVRIYAKRLGSTATRAVAETRGLLTTTDLLTVKTIAKALHETGTYRLEAVVAFSPADKEPTSPGTILESGFVNVY